MSKDFFPDSPALSLDLLDDIAQMVQPLKDERDKWKATAQMYKTAFESQTVRLEEAVELCLVTRAELENLRTQRQCSHNTAGPAVAKGTHSAKSHSSHTLISEGGQPTPAPKADIDWQSTPMTKATFGEVEQFLIQADVPKAREEIDRILPGRLSHEARVEGLLLKSAICRASGPDWALEGLAQCSEALTLCEKISGLSSLLPKIHYHRGLCLLRLRQLEQARDAFAAVQPFHPLHDGASKYRRSCDEELENFALSAKRRSAFDEHRSIDGFLAQSSDIDRTKRRRPSSTRIKFFSTSKPSRRSLSARWKSSTTA